MCGIVGVIQYESKVPRNVRHRALKILFSETLLKTEVRGKDATGLYQVHEDGDWLMTKKGQKVTDWVYAQRTEKCEDPIIYPEIMDAWIEHPRELTALVGHCRAATVGSKGKDNNDNHPFAVQLDAQNVILGIHNGTLTNHETIFDRLPKVLTRHGNVDSEAIFHFVYHLTERGTKPVTGDMLKYLGQRLDGAYAVIMVNTRFPHQVVTFRRERPVEYFLISPLNIVMIASDKKFVDSALEKYNFIRNMGLDSELPELHHYDQMLPDRDYRIFDATAAWPADRPRFDDINKISEKGEMAGFNSPVLAEWRGPVKTSTSSTSWNKGASQSSTGGAANSTTGGSNKPGATTGGASTTTPASSGVRTTKKSEPSTSIPAKAGGSDEDEDAGVMVEVEIGGEADAKRGLEAAEAWGLVNHYESAKEVAKAVGIDVEELKSISGLDLANKLAQLHAAQGYAVARLATKSEVTEIRQKAARQTKKMERLASKQGKAEQHIWEHRQVIIILLALAAGRYQLNTRNVGIALAAFPKLPQERRNSILNAAKKTIESKEVQGLIDNLVERLRAAERRVSQKNKGAGAE